MPKNQTKTIYSKLFSLSIERELGKLKKCPLELAIKSMSDFKKPNPIKKQSLIRKLRYYFVKKFKETMDPRTFLPSSDIFQNFDENIGAKIFEAYNELLNSPQKMDLISKIHEKKQKIPKNNCFCSTVSSLKNILPHRKLPILTCVNAECSKICHAVCLSIPNENIKNEETSFECPICILMKNDPLLENIRVLMMPTIIIQANDCLQQRLIIDDETFDLIKKQPNIGLLVKSVKLEAKFMNDQSWPDYGDLFLNNKRMLDFKPLQSNSSLKKRKDVPLFISDGIYSGINILKITTNRPPYHVLVTARYNEKASFMVAAFLVKRLTSQELIEKIQKNNVRSIEECKQQIFNSLNKCEKDEISLDKVAVNLLDTFDLLPIKTPAKTRFCSHIQCFSLENLINSMEFTTSPRRWKCPICKIKAWDLIIDGYQWEIIKSLDTKNEKVTEIFFFKNGTYEIVKSKELKRPRAEECEIIDFANNIFIKNEENIYGEICKKKVLEVIEINLESEEQKQTSLMKENNKKDSKTSHETSIQKNNINGHTSTKTSKQKRLLPIPRSLINSNKNGSSLSLLNQSNNNNKKNLDDLNASAQEEKKFSLQNDKIHVLSNNNTIGDKNNNNDKNGQAIFFSNNNNSNDNPTNKKLNNVDNDPGPLSEDSIGTKKNNNTINSFPLNQEKKSGQEIKHKDINKVPSFHCFPFNKQSQANSSNLNPTEKMKASEKMDNILKKINNSPHIENLFINCGPLVFTEKKLNPLIAANISNPLCFINEEKNKNETNNATSNIYVNSRNNKYTISKNNQIFRNKYNKEKKMEISQPKKIISKPATINLEDDEEDNDDSNSKIVINLIEEDDGEELNKFVNKNGGKTFENPIILE